MFSPLHLQRMPGVCEAGQVPSEAFPLGPALWGQELRPHPGLVLPLLPSLHTSDHRGLDTVSRAIAFGLRTTL